MAWLRLRCRAPVRLPGVRSAGSFLFFFRFGRLRFGRASGEIRSWSTLWLRCFADLCQFFGHGLFHAEERSVIRQYFRCAAEERLVSALIARRATFRRPTAPPRG